MRMFFTGVRMTKSSVWNKRVLLLLPLFGMLLGIAQGHSVYAYTGDFAPTTYTINNTTYEVVLRAVYNQPTLVSTYTNETDTRTYYQWETDVSINMPFMATTGYYNGYSTVTFNLDYPSGSEVVYGELVDYENTDGHNISLYSTAISSVNNRISGYFRVFTRDYYFQRLTNSYQYNLVKFKVKIVTTKNTQPTLSITNNTSNINFSSTKSFYDLLIDALDNSDTAEDIADILSNSGLTLTEVRTIATRLGITNQTLSYIQEYAYEIYNILNNAFPTEASSAMDNAEEQFNNIAESMSEYALAQPNINNIQNNAQDGFMSQTQGFESNSIFWYYNWPWILGILVMVIGIAIISYILYGGK